MTRPAWFLLVLCVAAWLPARSCPAADAAATDLARATAERIRVEATRGNDDPGGRPLPLAAHWNTGSYPPEDTFDPQYQLALIESGHHVMPFLNMPGPGPLPKKMDYWERALKRAAELRLPFALIASQWESILTYDKAYLELPADANPNVVAVDGKILHQVDPFGPVAPWREVGQKWGGSDGMRKLQEYYPDPPKVLLISNNEHAKLAWSDVEKAKRYVDQHGLGKDDDFKRRVVADGWIERYRALIGAFRQGLGEPWRKSGIFVGYDAFGPPHFARMGGWREYSLYVPGRIDWSPLVWDGGSPSFYTHNWNASTDYTVWSPQVEAMNWVFMQEEALALNPKFWFELGTWDGSVDQKNDKRLFYTARKHQVYDADRYGGMVQFGMWVNRPRSVREFRGWTEKRSVQGQYFLAVVAAVDRVHAEPVLTRFWRTGRLVPNTAHPHPYQAKVPEEYKSKDRWFMLDTSVDPPRPWGYGVELPVFSLALTVGEKGNREWLVYAHAPLGAKDDVKVTIPDYGEVTISAPPQGTFYHVLERTRSATAIKVPLLPAPPPKPVKDGLDP